MNNKVQADSTETPVSAPADSNTQLQATEATGKSQTKKSRAAILPMLLVAAVAVMAGIYVGTLSNSKGGNGRIAANEFNEESNASDIALLQETQQRLQNSTILSADFKSVPPFSLLHGADNPIDESSLRGQWSILFFGFTNCPDVCPITLNEVNSAFSTLTQEGITLPQVLFVTVDPNRDTPAKMIEYTNYFNEDFLGVSGDLADITALTTKLGIVASYTALEDDPEQYRVDHTASMLLIDPDLRVRGKFNPPHTADVIAADFKTMIAALAN